MRDFEREELSRRYFFGLGFSVASGILLPTSLGGCGKDGGVRDLRQQTFVQPAMLESENGLLHVTLTADYWNTELSGSHPDTKYSTSLRAYGYGGNKPSYAGPTLVVKGGDDLIIDLINHLPFNPPAAPNDPLLYMKPNTTNLHVHGLHVFPGIYKESNHIEYGDYVVDSNSGGVVPRGGKRRYRYKIPADHPAGPFYYHPQFHGSSAIQAASLMQGAILIRGPIDELPDMEQATELVFLFQAPYFAKDIIKNNFGVKYGSLEKFKQIAIHPTGHGIKGEQDTYLDAQPILINGVRQPTIVIKSGEVQRWRFINTQAFNYLNLNLDDHVLHQFTHDGWGTTSYQEFPDVSQRVGKGISLAAGNRSSVIVKAGKPGIYLLRSLPVKIDSDKHALFLPEDVLARIVVVDDGEAGALAKKIPDTPLPVSDFLKPIGDEEFARCGGRKRSILFNMKGGNDLITASDFQADRSNSVGIASDVASSAEIPITQNGARARADSARASGISAEDSGSSENSSMDPDYLQPQPSNSMVEYVVLGSVEEWTIFNFNSLCRPFHIHVNPMYVTKINGVPIDPFWCDTVNLPAGGTSENPTSVTFRMRFKDFSGPFVMHSQMLQESDLGLIQRVTVLPVE